MKMITSGILTVLFFIVFGLNLIIFHPIQIICKVFFGAKTHDKSVVLLNFLLTKSLFILGTRIQYNNFTNLPSDQPLIVICNHQSMWDIPPLIWMFRKHHLKFIAKKELAKNIPSISYNLKYGGSVIIDRKKPEEAVKKIRDFALSINNKKHAVCIFPEGTRSYDGKLRPFKAAGVRTMLKEMPEALIVPIAIKNTSRIDNKGKFLKNIGIGVSFTALTPRNISFASIAEELNTIQKEIKEIL